MIVIDYKQLSLDHFFDLSEMDAHKRYGKHKTVFKRTLTLKNGFRFLK